MHTLITNALRWRGPADRIVYVESCNEIAGMLRELFLSLTLTLTLTPGVASSNYGDCSCTCCAKVHPDLDCTPQYLGHNTLSSCASCSADFCAHQWPAACPSGPTSGGKDNFGGHNTFKCDGWADDPRPAPTLSSVTPDRRVTGASFILLTASDTRSSFSRE